MEKTFRLILIALLIIAILGFIIYNNYFNSAVLLNKFGSKIGNIKGSYENKINEVDCPSKIIPEKIVLYEAQGTAGHPESLYYVWSISTKDWKDGTEIERYEEGQKSAFQKIDDLFGLKCRKGSEEGENVNYFYCDHLLYNSVKNQIDNEGNIEGLTGKTYKINLVISQIENEEWYVKKYENDNLVDIYGNYSIVSSECIKL